MSSMVLATEEEANRTGTYVFIYKYPTGQEKQAFEKLLLVHRVPTQQPSSDSVNGVGSQ